MRRLFRYAFLLAGAGAVFFAVAGFSPGLIWRDSGVVPASFTPDKQRGAYLFRLSGCKSCHTASGKDAAELGGGRVLATPFGSLSVPNISPDRQAGIGNWRQQDFLRAMRLGISPEGKHYYPAFPYSSYTNMRTGDLLDIWAYLRDAKPVAEPVKNVELPFPFNIRASLGVWKLLFFSAAEPLAGRDNSEGVERGAYLVNGPGHCAECHTRRNPLGGWQRDAWLAGTSKGLDGKPMPGITAKGKGGIGKWVEADMIFALKYGMLPDGDVMGGKMGTVVEQNLSQITDADAKAIAAYLKSL